VTAGKNMDDDARTSNDTFKTISNAADYAHDTFANAADNTGDARKDDPHLRSRLVSERLEKTW
jgi:hypothetical protein